MTWVEALVPAVVIALLVRLDAIVIGPYWAIVELIQYEAPQPRVRKHTIWRRFLYPGLVAAGLVVLRPETVPMDGAIVGSLAALLLLWPIVFHGFPWHLVRRRSWLVVLYIAFVAGFFASGYLGAFVAVFVADLIEQGSLADFLADQIVPAAVVFTIGVISATVQERTATRIEAETFSDEE